MRWTGPMRQGPGYIGGWYPPPVPPVPYMADLMLPGVVAICLMTGLPGVAGDAVSMGPSDFDFIDVTPEPLSWEHPAGPPASVRISEHSAVSSVPMLISLPDLRLTPAAGDSDGVPVWASQPVELLPDEPVTDNE